MNEPLTIDPWSVLDHKGLPDLAQSLPPWMGEQGARRVQAYVMYQAYAENRARAFGETEERREYGDAALIVEQTLAHFLGETQEIEVPGSEREGSAEAAAHEWLASWADAEGFLLRLVDAERKAVTLGDAVYVVDIDQEKGRPRLGVFDPGLYFPVLPEDAAADDYPTRVHFAWEEERDDSRTGGVERVLRRLTYELRTRYVDGEVDGVPVSVEDPYRPAYATEDTTLECYLTDLTIPLTTTRGTVRNGFSAIDRLDLTRATARVREDGVVVEDLPLGIDFLPIVHVPNTVPGAEHFGQPVLAKVLQVLDDLQAADTDTQAAQATTGSPLIVLKNARTSTGQTIDVGPGKVVEVGADGDVELVDTTAPLAGMREQVSALQDRLHQNARLPDVALGRIRSSTDAGASGVSLTIRYGPLAAMIRQMRMVRSDKYRVLLRFIQRIGMVLGDGPGQVVDARLAFGAYMPQDTAAALTSAAEAYAAGVVSLETAVRMAQAGGAPIEDLVTEIEQIQSRDFRGAGLLADATGDVKDARRYLLGLELEEEPEEAAAAPVVLQVGAPATAPDEDAVVVDDDGEQ